MLCRFSLLLCCFVLLSSSLAVATKYDDATSMNMVLASASAYCKQAQVNNWSCRPCSRLPMTKGSIEYFSSSKYGVAGFVGVTQLQVIGMDILAEVFPQTNVSTLDLSSPAVMVSFRGSDNLKNWIQNIKFARTTPNVGGPCPGCKVHLGFHQAYGVVRSQLRQLVSRLATQFGAKTIIVTGHSMGGALANLAAWDILVDKLEAPSTSIMSSMPVLLYTYGQPRVGNHDFSKVLRSHLTHTWRVVNQKDMVPHLPPKMMGFHHLPTEVWFAREGDKCNWQSMCAYCDAGGEDSKCSNSVVPTTNTEHHMSYLRQPISNMC